MENQYESGGGFNEGQTKFDTGLSQVFRIDGELKRCNWFRRNNGLEDWHKCLMSLYAEGYPMFLKKQTEKKENKALPDVIKKKTEKKEFHPLLDHEEFEDKQNSFLGKHGIQKIMNDKNLLGHWWNILWTYELKLRANLDVIGLGHSEKDQEIY